MCKSSVPPGSSPSFFFVFARDNPRYDVVPLSVVCCWLPTRKSRHQRATEQKNPRSQGLTGGSSQKDSARETACVSLTPFSGPWSNHSSYPFFGGATRLRSVTGLEWGGHCHLLTRVKIWKTVPAYSASVVPSSQLEAWIRSDHTVSICVSVPDGSVDLFLSRVRTPSKPAPVCPDTGNLTLGVALRLLGQPTQQTGT